MLRMLQPLPQMATVNCWSLLTSHLSGQIISNFNNELSTQLSAKKITILCQSPCYLILWVEIRYWCSKNISPLARTMYLLTCPTSHCFVMGPNKWQTLKFSNSAFVIQEETGGISLLSLEPAHNSDHILVDEPDPIILANPFFSKSLPLRIPFQIQESPLFIEKLKNFVYISTIFL